MDKGERAWLKLLISNVYDYHKELTGFRIDWPEGGKFEINRGHLFPNLSENPISSVDMK